MANATNIAVTTCVANGTAAATLNLNTSVTGAQTLSLAAAGVSDRLILVCSNLATDATNTLNVAVVYGDNPPAFRAGLGTLTKSAIATATISTAVGCAATVLGPFESARFLQDDGTINVTIQSDGATNASAGWSIIALKLPVV